MQGWTVINVLSDTPIQSLPGIAPKQQFKYVIIDLKKKIWNLYHNYNIDFLINSLESFGC